MDTDSLHAATHIASDFVSLGYGSTEVSRRSGQGGRHV
jgi:hypothetical protein